MPDFSIADQHIDQASEDALYLPQGDTASTITTRFAVSNTDLSSWAPGSSISGPGGTDPQVMKSNPAPLTDDLFLTLPAEIAEDLEYIPKTDASCTIPNDEQELFVQRHENHVAELTKANDDLEQEIAALEEEWNRIPPPSEILYGPVTNRRDKWIWRKFESIAFRRTQLKEKLAQVKRDLERERSELQEVQVLQCLQAAKDLEAELPSLEKEIDRELGLLSQQVSSEADRLLN
jgi:hypothetical protein